MSIRETPERKGQTSSYVESDHTKEGGRSQWWCFDLKVNGGNSFYGEHDCTQTRNIFSSLGLYRKVLIIPFFFFTFLDFGQVVKVQTYSTIFRKKVLRVSSSADWEMIIIRNPKGKSVHAGSLCKFIWILICVCVTIRTKLALLNQTCRAPKVHFQLMWMISLSWWPLSGRSILQEWNNHEYQSTL